MNTVAVGASLRGRELNGGDTASACTALNDFISQVRAQQGKKKISAQDAEELIAEAQRIQAVLGCS